MKARSVEARIKRWRDEESGGESEGVIELLCAAEEELRRRTPVTVLDYFAALAPAEPQPWFAPDVGAEPAEPQLPAGLHPDTELAVSMWRKDSCFDLLPDYKHRLAVRDIEAVAAYVDAISAYWIARDNWRKARERARFVQWPYAWANAVLAARTDSLERDLLAACEAALKVISCLEVRNWPPGHDLKRAAIDQLCAAITKAGGAA